MDHQKIPTLVIDHCVCDGCKIKFNKLKKKIPQVHSVEFDTEQRKATIFGAVDPATVKKELAKKGIVVSLEESSPTNSNHQQKQIVSQKPSIANLQKQVQVMPHEPAESAAIRIHDESTVKKTPDGYLNHKYELVEVKESAGIRIQDKSIVKKTPDGYLDHEHELVEVKGFNKRFSCNGCKEDGFSLRYRCEPCNFDLHHECKSPKPTISPDFDEKFVLEFRPQPPKERLSCDACGKDIHGCFYSCKAKGKGMNLHPCCAKLKAQVSNEDMVLDLCKKVPSECLWCQQKKPPGNERRIPGWCYASKCKKYTIHIHCITQMLHQAWQIGLTDGSGENSIQTLHFQHMSVSDGNRRGGVTRLALKIIGILRIIVGILLGDPTVFFGSVMVQFLDQLLKN